VAATPAETVANPPGLRERKAAQTRLALAESLYQRLATAELADINVDELAADANVSRVTFFNYFATKRDAIDLMMVVLIHRIGLTLAREKLRGVAAIERIFSLVGDEVADAPQRWRRGYALFGARPAKAPMPELTRAERLLLAPDIDPDTVEVASLGYLFMRLVEEAREDGLELPGSSFEMSHFLGSVLNGAVITGHSGDDNDWKQLFRRHARRALGLLGVEGQSDPRAPRIPERYRTRPRAQTGVRAKKTKSKRKRRGR
jgi:AcrR family transcriptional regulator